MVKNFFNITSNPQKKKLLLQIQQSTSPPEITTHFTTLRTELSTLSDTLLSSELTLVEQFEEVLKEFERNYTELSSSITEFGATCFARMREIENEFHERLSEAVVVGVDRFIKGDVGEKGEVEDELRDVSFFFFFFWIFF